MRAWTQALQAHTPILISWTPPVAEHGEPLLLGLDSQHLLHPGQRVWWVSFCYFVFCEVSKIILLSQSLLELQGRKQRNRLLWPEGCAVWGTTTSFTAWLIYCTVKESAVQAAEIWKEAFYPSPKPSSLASSHSSPWAQGIGGDISRFPEMLLSLVPRVLIQGTNGQDGGCAVWDWSIYPIVFVRHTAFHVGLFWNRTRLCPDFSEYISFMTLFYFKPIKTLINQYALYDNSL